MVLLVIDAQIWLTNKDLYCYERFVNGTKKVIEAARENNIEVIYLITIKPQFGRRFI